MADSPPLAGYAGTFSGSPITINPWTDHGFVAQQVILIPTGTHGMTVTLGTNTLQIPAGVILTLPGPLNSFVLAGTATEGWIAYCAGQPIAGLVSAIVGGSTGGGGGGGAPTTAPYLVDAATAVAGLSAPVLTRALTAPIDFVWPTLAPGGAVTPFRLYGSDAASPPTLFGGVALPFRWLSSSGEQTVAQIGAVFTDVSNPANPKGALAFALGASETLAMLLTANVMQFAAATEIKGLANGGSADSAATVAQSAFGNIVFGALNSGSVGTANYLNVGGSSASSHTGPIASSHWRAPIDCRIRVGSLDCGVAPVITAGSPMYQEFVVLVNGTPTVFSAKLHNGVFYGAFSGTTVTVSAGDLVSVVGVNNGDAGTVGASDVIAVLAYYAL